MSTNSQDAFPKLLIIPSAIVVSVWVWVAVRTGGALQVISRGVIPYSKRVIWLLKILALVVGGGGAIGFAEELGAPWFLAIVPAGVILFFALREKVAEVVPPRPVQDASTGEMAWQEYDRLRKTYMRSSLWFGVAFLALILASLLAASWSDMPQRAQISLVAVFFAFWIASSVVLGFNQMKLCRWPCPRCGCAFRGLWARPWLPKRCVYCGLEREERNRN